ncbi:thioredoxin domain-containing protein [Cardiosporidium cionae]|uniref:Thioredoxin domain-containing protein n=1 Tax=Cardiosporidium cionae TaxID=476202 RepID=A0ABQ7J5A3_9APIC|nr:thioredoxin domain-containing protein [Cardiosporidium cionae]|eukprot:KAF8819162.1 thioredoxin domain-containing protein [Cardiosporidium cionae]
MHLLRRLPCLLPWLSLSVMFSLYSSLIFSIDNASATKLKRSAYDVLGIFPNATATDISKAYRLLVRKLHPDTHPEKKEQFLEVARAYELLKDAESRQRYDEYGDVDPDSYQNNNAFQNGNFQHSFRMHQGGFPGFIDPFSDFHFVFERGPGVGQRKEAPSLYKGTIVVEIDQAIFTKLLKRRDTMVLVNFYNPGCHRCESMTKEYIKLARLLDETVVVGAVNCARNQLLCSRQMIKQYPEILLFVLLTDTAPIRYTGAGNAKEMQRWIWTTSPFFGTVLTRANFNSWLDLKPQKPKVIYFSSNGTIPITLKVLAAEYSSSISVGSISKFEYLLSERFHKIPSLPAMLHVEDIDNLEGEWLDVEPLSKRRISLWLMRILTNNRAEISRYGGFSPYKELTNRRYVNGECAINDTRFCFILFKCGNPMETEIDQIIATISKNYKRDPVKFVWIDSRKQVSFVESFGISAKCNEQNGSVHFVAFRPKRQMYKILLDDLRRPSSIDNFVEIVLSGSLLFTDRLKKPIVLKDAEASRRSNEEL